MKVAVHSRVWRETVPEKAVFFDETQELHRKMSPSGAAAALHDLTARACFRTDEEPVRGGTLPFLGLVGRFCHA